MADESTPTNGNGHLNGNGKPIGRPKTTSLEKVEKKLEQAEADPAGFVERVAALGLTDAEFSKLLDINEDTLNQWKLDKEFLRALKAGKDEADEIVVASLFKRAIGYSHPDVHISNYQGMITETPITKHYAPDVVACIFWLKNRRANEWKDRKEITGADGSPLTVQLVMPQKYPIGQLVPESKN